MKISIVGAGWFGCHIAMKLREKHDITIYEMDGVFSKASTRNQNRLHLGYHYARNSATRKMCKSTFHKFKNDYGHLLSRVKDNIYAIPKYDSLIDYETYKKIFSDYNFDEVDADYLQNVQGVISVAEEFINPNVSRLFFKQELGKYIKNERVEELNSLSADNDLVINCSNNGWNPITENSFMEPCTIYLYRKISPSPFGALTFVDGPLFSIFPFYNNMVTVSDVQYTPDSQLSHKERRKRIEEKILFYYPDFQKHFLYDSMLSATKAKPIDKSDNRTPVITRDNNIINCFSGKIQGIYYLEQYIGELCEL